MASETSVLINRDATSHITIYQPYFQLCSPCRSPLCAAALIDVLERRTAKYPNEFVALAYKDFHTELCEVFWLQIIKDSIQWLVNTGYVECRFNPDDKDGLQHYRLNWHEIAMALSAVAG